jgi:hypothetical protein
MLTMDEIEARDSGDLNVRAYAIVLNELATSWSSHLQPTVAVSTVEAK